MSMYEPPYACTVKRLAWDAYNHLFLIAQTANSPRGGVYVWERVGTDWVERPLVRQDGTRPGAMWPDGTGSNVYHLEDVHEARDGTLFVWTSAIGRTHLLPWRVEGWQKERVTFMAATGGDDVGEDI